MRGAEPAPGLHIVEDKDATGSELDRVLKHPARLYSYSHNSRTLGIPPRPLATIRLDDDFL